MADSLASQFGKRVVKRIQVEDNSKWVAEGPVLPPPWDHMPGKVPTPIQCPQWELCQQHAPHLPQLPEPAGGANDSRPLEHPWRNPNPITKLLYWHEADIMASQFHLSVLKVR